jgi:hypothetical protein
MDAEGVGHRPQVVQGEVAIPPAHQTGRGQRERHDEQQEPTEIPHGGRI